MRVIVIGAGAIGLMAALRLAERGADVLVLESEPEGFASTRGASRAAAGMLGPLSETLYEHAGTHPRLLELGLASLDMWRTRGPLLALSTFPARGARLVGYSDSAIEALDARAKTLGRAIAQRDGALSIPDEAAIGAAEALGAIARAALERGAQIRRGVEVVAITAKQVTLADGAKESADAIVVATGAWSAPLIPNAPAISPVKGQILEVDSSALAPGETVRSPNAYAVGRAPGRVIIGATMEHGRIDLDTDEATIDAMRAKAAKIDPSLPDARVVRAWAGIRPTSADWAPRIGRVGDVFIARGHSRNGWLLAPITADMLCAYVFGEAIPDLWAAFAP